MDSVRCYFWIVKLLKREITPIPPSDYYTMSELIDLETRRSKLFNYLNQQFAPYTTKGLQKILIYQDSNWNDSFIILLNEIVLYWLEKLKVSTVCNEEEHLMLIMLHSFYHVDGDYGSISPMVIDMIIMDALFSESSFKRRALIFAKKYLFQTKIYQKSDQTMKDFAECHFAVFESRPMEYQHLPVAIGDFEQQAIQLGDPKEVKIVQGYIQRNKAFNFGTYYVPIHYTLEDLLNDFEG
ncbi:MAG: hypothetical protein ACRCXZ_01245 [Patescibacteria group bacterium]